MSFNWDVIRTTTDKLSETLNDLAWSVHQIQYVGGRDWVVIQRRKSIAPGSETYRGYAEHAASSRRVPSLSRS